MYDRAFLIPYKMRFREPFYAGGRKLDDRDGFHLLLTGDGQAAVGDCAAFPFVGTETAGDCSAALRSRLAELLPLDIYRENMIPELLEPLREKFPAAAFSLEQALYNGLKEFPEADADIDGILENNALIPAGDTAVLAERCSVFYDAGYRSFKTKVFPDNIDSVIKFIRDYGKQKADNVRWRLDANGSFDGRSAAHVLDLLQDLPVEYMEDPVPDLETMRALSMNSPVPLAADRLAVSAEAVKRLSEGSRLRIFTVKPLAAGGYTVVKEMISGMPEDGRIILSSSFEGETGLQWLEYMAASENCDSPQGLSVRHLFREFPESPSPAFLNRRKIQEDYPVKMRKLAQELLKKPWNHSISL